MRNSVRIAVLVTVLFGSGVMPGRLSAQPAALPFPLNVPPGFHIALISNRIPGARFIAVAPNGDVLVSLISQGEVVAIRPSEGVDQRPEVVAANLSRPNGLAFRGQDLYIGTWTGVSIIRNYASGNRRVEALFSNMPRNRGHNARAIAVAEDGTVFISSGSTCNVCTESDPRFATIMKYSPDGRDGGVYARGLRNASGLAFDAERRLWAVVNQRDNLYPDHTDFPPDELDLIRQGADYGWPECYPVEGRRVPNPEFPDADCTGTEPTAFNFQAHSAPLQIAFKKKGGDGAAGAFPPRYDGALFVAFHGSWNRQPPTGYKVVVVTFRDGRPIGVEDFATGWLSGGRRVLGRPVGVAFAPDGTLFISDDRGYLFHVTYRP